MKRVVVDTNVLVSFLTDRDAEQQARAAGLFESAAAGELEVILHQMVISEMIYVLGNLYQVEAAEIARTLSDLLSSPGVTAVDEVVWSRVLELWPDRLADFADAVLAEVAFRKGYDAGATFDQRFVRQLRREGVDPHWTTNREDDEEPDQAEPEVPGTEDT